jgi:hypothetical protein
LKTAGGQRGNWRDKTWLSDIMLFQKTLIVILALGVPDARILVLGALIFATVIDRSLLEISLLTTYARILSKKSSRRCIMRKIKSLRVRPCEHSFGEGSLLMDTFKIISGHAVIVGRAVLISECEYCGEESREMVAAGYLHMESTNKLVGGNNA